MVGRHLMVLIPRGVAFVVTQEMGGLIFLNWSGRSRPQVPQACSYPLAIDREIPAEETTRRDTS